MYKEHPVFKKPDNENVKIWRYIDFTKFISLLEKQALFFTRGDNLPDKFEGSVSRANIKLREESFKDLNKKTRENVLKMIPLSFTRTRKWIFINCWNLHENESAAMWKLYLKSNEGIAIQSTFERFAGCFNKTLEHDVYIGEIKYIDYDKDWMPEGFVFYPFLHKRKSYEHEHELRAIIMLVWDMGDKKPIKDLSDTGIYIPIDIDVLIERIFVSPTAEKWFKKLVESIMKKYNLNKEVKQSSLADDPVY